MLIVLLSLLGQTVDFKPTYGPSDPIVLTVKGAANDAGVFWLFPDSVGSVQQGLTCFCWSAPQDVGGIAIVVDFATKKVTGIKFKFTVTGASPPTPVPPPTPPDPVPPAPTDLRVKIQQLYDADTSPTKSIDKTSLASTYGFAVSVVLNDQTFTTVKQLVDDLHSRTQDIIGDRLGPIRRALADDLNKRLPRKANQALDSATRAQYAAQFQAINTILLGVK